MLLFVALVMMFHRTDAKIVELSFGSVIRIEEPLEFFAAMAKHRKEFFGFKFHLPGAGRSRLMVETEQVQNAMNEKEVHHRFESCPSLIAYGLGGLR